MAIRIQTFIFNYKYIVLGPFRGGTSLLICWWVEGRIIQARRPSLAAQNEIDTMGIETLAAQIQGYELRSANSKGRAFQGFANPWEREKGDVDVIEMATSPPNRWSEAKFGEFHQVL
ncbi:hypothetical protein H5410_042753 [Solanum commersonii]|uniref:Uncharacterized protein n=1 Tax=Solanum commersonii TaxID=4109 RepID=A0A9J5XX86_SOLCO|nr:hypothetical protein H5410_042753 [Solanum commersonii]